MCPFQDTWVTPTQTEKLGCSGVANFRVGGRSTKIFGMYGTDTIPLFYVMNTCTALAPDQEIKGLIAEGFSFLLG